MVEEYYTRAGSKQRSAFTRLHGVMFQKIVTAVRISGLREYDSDLHNGRRMKERSSA
jgi:hypothetical protein